MFNMVAHVSTGVEVLVLWARFIKGSVSLKGQCNPKLYLNQYLCEKIYPVFLITYMQSLAPSLVLVTQYHCMHRKEQLGKHDTKDTDQV